MAAIRWILAASMALMLASVAVASTDLGADGQMARALRVLESSSSVISGAKMQRYNNMRRMLASLELQSQCL